MRLSLLSYTVVYALCGYCNTLQDTLPNEGCAREGKKRSKRKFLPQCFSREQTSDLCKAKSRPVRHRNRNAGLSNTHEHLKVCPKDNRLFN